MNIMIDRPRKLVLLAVIAAGMLPAAAANAHCCRSSYAEPAPLYPYAVPEEQFYAVELAPNVYAVPYATRAYPYVHCLDGCGSRAPTAEWRRRGYSDRAVVIETERGIEDAGAPRENGKQRVIRAEAEVTIIGPDRMNIRLFRKEQGSNAKSRAE
jgi:hypothetical protein